MAFFETVQSGGTNPTGPSYVACSTDGTHYFGSLIFTAPADGVVTVTSSSNIAISVNGTSSSSPCSFHKGDEINITAYSPSKYNNANMTWTFN